MRSSLKRDTIWSIIGSAFPLLVAFFSVPLAIKVFGEDGFGLIAIMWALVGYFGIFDLGVGRALTYELSRDGAVASGRSDSIKSGLLISLVMGVVGALLIGLVFSRNAYHWFKVTTLTFGEVEMAFLVVGMAVIPATVTSTVRGALEGLGQFKKSNIIKILVGVISFGSPYLAVMLQNQNKLMMMAVALVAGRSFIMLLAILSIRRHISFDGSGWLKNSGRLFSYGVWVTVSGLVSPLMVYGDRFFVSNAIGASVMQYYAIPQEGIQKLLILPAALAAALLPRLAAEASIIKVDQTYKRSLWIVAMSMFFVCGVAAYVTPIFFSYWISPEFSEKSFYVVMVLLVGVWFNSVAQIPYSVLSGKGFPRLIALAHLFELPVYIGVIYLLANAYGLVGAALAWSVRALMDLMILAFLTNRYALSSRKG